LHLHQAPLRGSGAIRSCDEVAPPGLLRLHATLNLIGRTLIMKLQALLSISVLAVIGVHPAFAQGARTRAEVRAELAQAIHSGDLLGAGEAGIPLNQLHPQQYPAIAHEAGKSREQVRAELDDALRSGDIVAGGESSQKRNEINPSLYPPVVMAAGKTREEAKAELAEALRTGDVLAGGEVSATFSQLYPYEYRDGHRAFAQHKGTFSAQQGKLTLSY
jgi:hypothetical protein